MSARDRAQRMAALAREHQEFRARLRVIADGLKARREAREDVWGVELQGGAGGRVAAALAAGKDGGS